MSGISSRVDLISEFAGTAQGMAQTKRGVSGGDDGKSAKRPMEKPSVTDSPLKRLKAKVQARKADRVTRETVVLSTVDEFRTYVGSTDQEIANVDVVVRGKLLWVSSHNFSNRQLLRLHLTEAEPEEPMEELMEFQQTYETDEEGRNDVDEALLTAAVFSATLEMPNLPRSGDVLRIVNSRKRMVYEGRCCQLVARLSEITVE